MANVYLFYGKKNLLGKINELLVFFFFLIINKKESSGICEFVRVVSFHQITQVIARSHGFAVGSGRVDGQ